MLERYTKIPVQYDVGDSLDYRGVHIDFLFDPIGQQIVAPWKDGLVEFGSYNTMYADDMKLLIDESLDTITRFEDYPDLYGSKLEYFQNASNRDIRLSHRGRILKIYLGDGAPAAVADAVPSLRKYLKFNKSINQ